MMMKLTWSIKKYFKCIVACSRNTKNLVKIQIACFMDTTNLGLQCMMATADKLYKKLYQCLWFIFRIGKNLTNYWQLHFSHFECELIEHCFCFHVIMFVYFENANAHLKISLFPSLFQFMLKLLQFPCRDSLKTFFFFMCTSYRWNRLCWGKKQLPSSWSILIILWFDEVTGFTYHILPAY